MTSSALDTDRQEYTAEDIRYTMHNGALYAIALGWSEGASCGCIRCIAGIRIWPKRVCSVRLLGSPDELQWRIEADGLHIRLPERAPDEAAFVFRILAGESGGRRELRSQTLMP